MRSAAEFYVSSRRRHTRCSRDWSSDVCSSDLGVSRFLFVALALAVVLSLFASYFVAMTVVPLFCAKLIKQRQADEELGDTFTWRWDGIGQMFNFYFKKEIGRAHV